MVACVGLGSRLRDLENATAGGLKVCYKVEKTTTTNAFEQFYNLPIADNTVYKIDIELVSRDDSGVERAMFERVGLFYREGGGAVIAEGFWHTSVTKKTKPQFDIEYILNASSIDFRVRSPIVGDCYWRGIICYLEVSTLQRDHLESRRGKVMANIIGLITVNGKEILEVDAVPSAGAGTPAPVGSLAMFDNASVGQLYLKTGAADTAWGLIEVPDQTDWNLLGNTLTGSEFFGSLNDQDVIFRRNNIELMRMIGATAANQALLIGLNATLGGRLQLGLTDGQESFKEILDPTGDQVIHVTRMHRLETVGAVTDTFSLAIPSDFNAKVESGIVAIQHAGAVGAVGDGASYQRTCHARNIGGTVTMFKQQTDYTYEIVNGLDFNLSASGANIVGTVQGVTDREISWGVHSKLLLIGLPA